MNRKEGGGEREKNPELFEIKKKERKLRKGIHFNIKEKNRPEKRIVGK